MITLVSIAPNQDAAKGAAAENMQTAKNTKFFMTGAEKSITGAKKYQS